MTYVNTELCCFLTLVFAVATSVSAFEQPGKDTDVIASWRI